MMSLPPPIPQAVNETHNEIHSTGSSRHVDANIGNIVGLVPVVNDDLRVGPNDTVKHDLQRQSTTLSTRVEGQNEQEEDIIEELGSGEYGSDSDYSGPVKLFVGQVPKAMNEQDLYPFFEKFGPINDVTIIRDKHTGQHRGCAFLTFINRDDAESCEAVLHDQYVLADGKKPVQIRPAGKKEEESVHKLFIGMLPQDSDEEMIRELFQEHGEIVGVFIIRGNNRAKKGCAFVKYAKRESALAAIESMHDQILFEGSARPLIVKMADTRSQRKVRQAMHPRRMAYSSCAPHESTHNAGIDPYYVPHGPHPVHHYPGHVTTAGVPQYPPHVAQFMYQQVHPYSIPHGSYPNQGGHANIPKTHSSRGGQRNSQQRNIDIKSVEKDDTAKPREGPAGANLFIYHLPHDLTDADLATAFNPFGNVISAKIYIDIYTGESKGFGFVSYDSVLAAEHAIEQMNGFQIGSKRLKVQHKRVSNQPQMNTAGVQSYYPLSVNPLPQNIPPSIEIMSEKDKGNVNNLQTDSQREIDMLAARLDSLISDEMDNNHVAKLE